IPNREVKPLMADGTAPQCGRVGSCHIYLKKPFELVFKRLFCFIAIPINFLPIQLNQTPAFPKAFLITFAICDTYVCCW
ncbi:MAG TPA: hypothetical protein VF008_17840, partial [Niastella sp.]